MYYLNKLEEDNINIINKINNFNNPKYIYIPILSNSTFKLNEYVYKNTYFDIYNTSVSGYIKDIKKIKLNNREISSIVIENDYKENIRKRSKYKKPNNREELIKLLDEYKLVDIINKINSQTIINNLVASSIDEEVYSISEYTILSKYYEDILDTLDYLSNILGSNKSILTTKNTDFNSIKNVNSILGTYPNIKVVLVPNKYLISYKSFLCSYLNVSSNETLVLSTNDLYNIYKCLNNKIIDDKIITVSGNAIKKSLIINTKLYVSLRELLDEFIDFNCDNYNIYINGYVGGRLVNNIDDIIITSDIHTIVINKIEEISSTECINCGACLRVCPKNINVKRCFFNNLKNNKCISCGLCDYICPANLDLRNVVEGNNEEV